MSKRLDRVLDATWIACHSMLVLGFDVGVEEGARRATGRVMGSGRSRVPVRADASVQIDVRSTVLVIDLRWPPYWYLPSCNHPPNINTVLNRHFSLFWNLSIVQVCAFHCLHLILCNYKCTVRMKHCIHFVLGSITVHCNTSKSLNDSIDLNVRMSPTASEPNRRKITQIGI